MALSPTDFTEPEGELRPDMFPGVDDLEAEGGYLSTWITQAEEEVAKTPEELTEEEATAAERAYVLYRAYQSVWLRLTTNPREADMEEDGSLRYSDAQVARFEELASRHEAEFERLTEVDPDKTDGAPARSQSVSSTTRLF